MKKKPNRYRQERRSPNKAVVRWGKVSLGVVVCWVGLVLLSAAFAHSYYALLDAPWFQLEAIDITGLHHVSEAEVLNALGVPRHANVLSLRMSRLAQRVESMPWIKSAVVRLDLPRRMVVEVVERRPLAIVHCNHFYLLGRDGRLFVRATVQQHPGLLLVTGFSRSEFDREGVLEAEPLAALKSLFAALEHPRHGLLVRNISECHWSREAGFTLYTLRGSIPIELGRQHFALKLERLQRIFSLLAQRHCLDAVTRIDLDYANRAYVAGHFQTGKGV